MLKSNQFSQKMQLFERFRHLYVRNLKEHTMTRYIRIFTSAIIVAAIALFTSCKKDNTLYYGNVTMGNFAGDKFISDQGNEFTIVENLTGEEFKGIKRAIMRCDILQKTAGTENGYDVRVSYVGEVKTKEPLTFEVAAEDPEKVVEDPILVDQAWISGGYLNLYVMFEMQVSPALENSKHMVNLVYDPASIGTGKIALTLRHNSFGETLGGSQKEDDGEGSGEESGEGTESGSDKGAGTEDSNAVSTMGKEIVQWGLAGAYVSFQLSEIITDQSAELTLQWKQHIISNFGWQDEVEDKSHKMLYSKDYFEHAPLTLKSKTVRLK